MDVHCQALPLERGLSYDQSKLRVWPHSRHRVFPRIGRSLQVGGRDAHHRWVLPNRALARKRMRLRECANG